MAGACGCESCRGKACGRVAVRVAVERLAEGFGGWRVSGRANGRACGCESYAAGICFFGAFKPAVHGLSVLARAISFSCMVFQRACHA